MNMGQNTIADPPPTHTLTFHTLTAGDSFALVDQIPGGDFENVARNTCDQVIVSPEGTCWTIEVHTSHESVSLWALAKQYRLDAIYIGREISEA